MTTRAEIEEVIDRWGETDSCSWPRAIHSPVDKHHFNLAFALVLHQKPVTAGPMYDDNDVLVGWHGVRPKSMQ